MSVIERCPLLGDNLKKIVTFKTQHFVRYSWHVCYLGCPLLGGFTVLTDTFWRLSNKMTYMRHLLWLIRPNHDHNPCIQNGSTLNEFMRVHKPESAPRPEVHDSSLQVGVSEEVCFLICFFFNTEILPGRFHRIGRISGIRSNL